MAGTVMHLVIADRLIEQLNIQNPGYFYCGNLAPDAIMNRENYVREMKRHTHFKDGIRLHEFREPENFKAYLVRLMDFYHTLVEKPDPHHEIYFGYLTHLLVDELYVLHFRDGFVDQLVAEGKEPTDIDFFRKFTRDVYMVDLELVQTHSFRYPMPETLRIKETYEIPGFITSKELLDSKEFVIHANFLQGGLGDHQERDEVSQFYFPDRPKNPGHPAEELQVMTMEQNLRFIELCVSEIPKLLLDRFGMDKAFS